ncbi:hypothetical protein DIQ79_22455 [Mycolicibacterium smegmatis]|uniref:Uncharacterized protein n=1 Tax=Mycolicibacterium smegmatis (strain ATCC 700084 / mc(2)155) TaxID=246196 RepID=A0R1W0_MYCS2|nr:conserved hypothetical protein [Mycolicibacterium smegmatis MC2 155]TBM34398.1 hypothetical protein DIQ86_33485 [Mycolicibacterium smegmatis]TBH33654.1 hypothetical protein EYS45_21480 [Mycolicibacterium smegmatis MC2 155]TBM49008.1 hypothetical protein DIQ85_22465 [Mycolicibacterium smegmatis]TBM58610.1 hypothetical protein DIQ83_22185 [Mycolicibacterium smegmatis]
MWGCGQAEVSRTGRPAQPRGSPLLGRCRDWNRTLVSCNWIPGSDGSGGVGRTPGCAAVRGCDLNVPTAVTYGSAGPVGAFVSSGRRGRQTASAARSVAASRAREIRAFRDVMPVARRERRCGESRLSKVAFVRGRDQNRGVNLESFQKTRTRRWDAVNGSFDDR